jgi:hypothetical protein
MVARLIMFLLWYAMLFAVPVGAAVYLGRHRLKEWRDERRHRLQAEHNAKLLMAHEHERCFECLEYDPPCDCYEDGKGWYHSECLKALLGGGEDQ